MELEAYDSGVLRKILVPEGGKAGIGVTIGIIADANEDITGLLNDIPQTADELSKTEKGKDLSNPEQDTLFSSTDKRIKASPLAKRLAEENKIELHDISGSGPQGRIIKRDIEALIGGKKPISTITPPSIIPGGHRDVELSLIEKP